MVVDLQVPELLQHRYFLATTMICSLSALNSVLTNTCLGNMGLDLVAWCLAVNPLDAIYVQWLANPADKLQPPPVQIPILLISEKYIG